MIVNKGSVLHSEEMRCAWSVVCRYTDVVVADGRRPGEAVGVQL